MENEETKPVTPTSPVEQLPVEENKDARMWGMLCHIASLAGFILPFGNLLGPLVVWQMKKAEFPFVDDQGKESLNFQIVVTICMVVAIALCFVCIGMVIAPIVGIAAIVFTIMAALKANTGVKYRYPFNWRLIK